MNGKSPVKNPRPLITEIMANAGTQIPQNHYVIFHAKALRAKVHRNHFDAS
jgi:hypothetical protein